MRGRAGTWGLSAVGAIALVVCLSAAAVASGSGYNQSYTQSPTTSNASVALTAVSSSYSSGLDLNASFTVEGSLVLNNEQYGYFVWFGGTTEANSTAEALFSNNTTAGEYYAFSSGSYSFGGLPYSISGSTLTFAIPTSIVGPSSTFSIDVYAWYEATGGTSAAFSWLGTDYANHGTGGGGSCGATGCSSTSSGSGSSSGLSAAVLGAIIGAVVVIAIVAVVVVLLVRRRRPPMQAQPGAPGAVMPPPPPGAAPPPPPPPAA